MNNYTLKYLYDEVGTIILNENGDGTFSRQLGDEVYVSKSSACDAPIHKCKVFYSRRGLTVFHALTELANKQVFVYCPTSKNCQRYIIKNSDDEGITAYKTSTDTYIFLNEYDIVRLKNGKFFYERYFSPTNEVCPVNITSKNVELIPISDFRAGQITMLQRELSKKEIDLRIIKNEIHSIQTRIEELSGIEEEEAENNEERL